MTGDSRNRIQWLAVIAVLSVVAALTWSYPISMPLTAAIFIIACVWPLKPRFDRIMPPVLSYIATILVLTLVLTAFGASVWYALSEVIRSLLDRQDQFLQLQTKVADWARANHISLPWSERGNAALFTVAQSFLEGTYTALAYLGSIAVLVLMGLPEVPVLRRKLERDVSPERGAIVLDLSHRIARAFSAYVRVKLLTSLITGAASGAWAMIVGLELALTWAMLNFLLNFIPIVGNIVGIVPPVLYAAAQFQDWTMPIVTLIGFTVLQVAISNFIEPWLEGQGMSLSPVGVVVAVGFWGWIWGIAGALLAVPLTAAVVIICDRFDGARWFATLLRQERSAAERRYPEGDGGGTRLSGPRQ